jgi:UDP-GlcNAc:undecaprenyl-phosphate/decaprenyl-phosphate GlcNAc-1-phosphate transferase
VSASIIIATVLLGFGVSCLFVWTLIPVAKRVGLVDKPGGRKTHAGAVPTIGGVAIGVAVIGTALVLGFAGRVHQAFWAGLLVIMLVGTLDDLRDLGHQSKFLAQIAAAGLMLFWGGWHLHTLGNLVAAWPLGLGMFAMPLTFVAVVGVINAVNFTDGADGLAGGLVFNALLWFCVLGLRAPPAALPAVSPIGSPAGEVQIALAFLGAVAGFLVFNLRGPGRRQALVFLGDAGSLGLGYALAWFTVSGAEGSMPLFAPVTAIWLLAVPLVDTLACSGRRLLNGTSPFMADRNHLHHILVDLGLPVGKAVALIHGCAFVLGAIAVAAWYRGVAEYVMFYAAMAIFAAYLVFSAQALRIIAARRQLAVSRR